MKSTRSRILTIASLSIASLSLALWSADAPAQAAPARKPTLPTLKACVDIDDPPFSAQSTPDEGIDVEIAEVLAERLGRSFQPVWVRVPARGGLSRALRQNLGAGQCDVYLGIPQGPDMAAELAELKLAATGTYLQLGYVLVIAPGKPAPTAESLRKARKVGAVTATPADLYLHRMDLPRSPYANSAALIAGLKAGEVDLALVWSPALAGEAGRGLVRAASGLGDADLVTGLTVALRAADTALVKDVTAVVEALRAEGRFDAIAERQGLPRVSTP